jgi:heavy metal efflux system protein
MLDIKLNRDAMARLGVAAQDVQETIGSAIGGRGTGSIYEGALRFPVMIRFKDADSANFATLEQVPVPIPGGHFVRQGCDRERRPASRGRLSRMGWSVRECSICARSTGACRPGLLRADHVPSLRRAPFSARRGDRLHGRFTGTGRQVACAGATRDALLDLKLGRDIFIAHSGMAVPKGFVVVTSVQHPMRNATARAQASVAAALLRFRPVVVTALVASRSFVPTALVWCWSGGANFPRNRCHRGLISATLPTLFLLPTLYALSGHREISVWFVD